jgi:hypothetical protein
MAKLFIDENTLTNIGNAIREKEGSSDLIPVVNMADRITAIKSGIPEEILQFSGNCSYQFYYGRWNNFLKAADNKLRFDNVTDISYMFAYAPEDFPISSLEINGKDGECINIKCLFNQGKDLLTVPSITVNGKLGDTSYLFQSCSEIKSIPESFKLFDWASLEELPDDATTSNAGMFSGCGSLREIPTEIISHGFPNATYSSSVVYSIANSCTVLDEIVDIFCNYKSTWTSNAFSSSFQNCARLKNITFKTNNGVPYSVKWKSQTITLSGSIGYASAASYLNGILKRIPEEKQVTDDASYQALKNDKDWFTSDVNYCRYNHDSAVATINSLPDTSAYLAEKGGTNTIKFKGAAGAKTDGGAIKTLTAEEIAVATAKGWTVSLA